MNILISGVNGFVGNAIVQQLKEGHYLIGIGTQRNTKSLVDDYFQWNIGQQDCYFKNEIGEIDVIVHAAACINNDDTDLTLSQTNCVGTQRICDLAIEKKVKRVYYISSIPVIGVPQDIPITEEHLLRPNTVYHATKLAGEFIIEQLRKRDISVVTFRIPSPIGPGMPIKTILPIFIQKSINDEKISILGSGTREQNYLDVRDLTELLEQTLDLDEIDGVYNIAAAKSISNVELAKLCVKLVNSTSQIVFLNEQDILEKQKWVISCDKAIKKLNYRPRHSIKESIIDIAREMKET